MGFERLGGAGRYGREMIGSSLDEGVAAFVKMKGRREGEF